ncbi:hypothetical protein, partial [Psychroserpens mesophilus]|uniref:hypothetical protein n=1 Tax=Psychroserpens mesophilus TaxID=325473 RepID=UPI003D646E57
MTTEELKDLPGLEKVQKGIQRLENVAWPEYDRKMKPDQYVKRVSKIITQEFNLLPSVLKTLAPNE